MLSRINGESEECLKWEARDNKASTVAATWPGGIEGSGCGEGDNLVDAVGHPDHLRGANDHLTMNTGVAAWMQRLSEISTEPRLWRRKETVWRVLQVTLATCWRLYIWETWGPHGDSIILDKEQEANDQDIDKDNFHKEQNYFLLISVFLTLETERSL